MYIGPWQEYTLSKSRHNKSTVSRRDVEAALLNTLGAEQAKAALEAMKPFLSEVVPSNQKKSSVRLPFLQLKEENLPKEELRTQSTRLPLHPSPISVRSTKSEPIKVAPKETMLKIKVTVEDTVVQPSLPILTSIKGRLGDQPAYNSPAMLNMLRLERRTSTRNKISKITGWDGGGAAVKSAAAPKRLDPIEKINEMRNTYLNLTNQCKEAPIQQSSKVGVEVTEKVNRGESSETSSTFAGISSSGGGAIVIQERDVDEEDLRKISKYFAHTTSSRDISTPIDPPAVSLPPIDYAYIPKQKENLTSSHSSQGAVGIAAESATAAIAFDDDDVSKLDDLYVGGIDGLLKWSYQLDLENI